MNVVLVHGAGLRERPGRSGDWQHEIQEALGPAYRVPAPLMPDPENPRYDAWAAALRPALRDATIAVGHSLGGTVLLKLLAGEPSSIRTVYTLGSPYFGPGGWDDEGFSLPDDLSRLPRIVLSHSRDDEVVPFEHLALFAARLPHAVVRAVDGQGHYFRRGLDALVDDLR